jgi:hypothetical protein
VVSGDCIGSALWKVIRFRLSLGVHGTKRAKKITLGCLHGLLSV